MLNLKKNIQKVLFIRFGAIGDIVHTTAAYQTMRQSIKNSIIDYLTSSTIQELIKDDQMLNRIISLDDYSYDGLFRISHELSEERYDLIVNLQPSLKTFFFTTVLHGGQVLTYKKFKPRGDQKHIHAVKNFYQTIEKVIPDATIPDSLKLYIDPNVLKMAKSKMETDKIRQPIGIVPGVSNVKRGRLWPKEYWIELLDYLANSKAFNIIIFGGLNEFELASELQKVNIDKIRNFCGKLSISQTAAMLAHCLLVIGGDTGPTHIATALAPKVVGLYGATDPERTGLYGNNHQIIHSHFECLFCEKKHCKYLQDNISYAPCMKALSPNDVIKQLGL